MLMYRVFRERILYLFRRLYLTLPISSFDYKNTIEMSVKNIIYVYVIITSSFLKMHSPLKSKFERNLKHPIDRKETAQITTNKSLFNG